MLDGEARRIKERRVNPVRSVSMFWCKACRGWLALENSRPSQENPDGGNFIGLPQETLREPETPGLKAGLKGVSGGSTGSLSGSLVDEAHRQGWRRDYQTKEWLCPNCARDRVKEIVGNRKE